MDKKILVVDDVFNNIKVIINYLKDLNYEIYFATSGEKAIQSIQNTTPDLILMDVMMPVLDGLETVKKIKQDSRYKDIPVIFITALSDPEDISKGFKAGGVDYISKPVNSIELIARIKIHLQLEEHRKLLAKIVEDEKNEIDYLKMAQKQLVESEKMASLGGLVAGVAHEINTPLGIGLTGITHFLHISEEINNLYNNDNMSEAEFTKFLTTTFSLANTININLEKAAELIRSFKRIAIDQSHDKQRTINLKNYIEEVLLSLTNITKDKNIIISIHCDEKMEIATYPSGLYQILSNLVINSFIHAFDNVSMGKINMDIVKNKNIISLQYKDDGKGIDEETISKIFDPFFTTNRAKGGTGLGLNVVYNTVITVFKGSIECTSQLNKGTTFNMALDIENTR